MNKENQKFPYPLSHTPYALKEGQMIIAILIFLAIGTVLSATFFSTVSYHTLTTQKEIDKERASSLADAGINRALYELRASSSWSGIAETIIDQGSYEVILATSSATERVYEATGYVPNKSQPKAKRKIRVTITSSPGAGSFRYAVQAGAGGFQLDSNATVNGNAYSNGNITCDSNATITGDAKAVGTISPSNCSQGQSQSGAPSQPLPEFDQVYWRNAANQNPSSGCPTTSSLMYTSGETMLGPCQVNGSLTLDSNAKLIMTGSIYVTGNFRLDSNSELRLDDSFGKNNTVLLVDGTVRLSSNSAIRRAQITSTLRPNGDYTNQWSVTNASTHWDALDEAVTQPAAGSTSDGYISSATDGQIDEFDMTTVSNIATTSEIVVWAYARTTGNDELGINLVVGGSPQGQQNKSLTTSFGWVNATFTVSLSQSQVDGLRVRLVERRQGAQDSVEVATMYSTVRYTTPGGGYIMVASATSTEPAISLDSNTAGGAFYSLNDTVRIDSNVGVVAVTGQKIHLGSNAKITYDSGLPNSSFSSGPGGGWSIKGGSWLIVE